MENKVPEKEIKAAVKLGKAERIKNIMVGAIIDMGDKEPLLLRRKHSKKHLTKFELPCGLVKGREKVETAIVRVVSETTGLEVESIESYVDSCTFDLEDPYEEWSYDLKEGYKAYRKKRAYQLNFVVKVKPGGQVTLSKDYMGYVTYPVHTREYMALKMPLDIRWILTEVFGIIPQEDIDKIMKEHFVNLQEI